MLNIPSFLSSVTEYSLSDNGLFNNFLLRIGEVKEIILPDSKQSLSKRTIEYNVAVQHKDYRLNTGYVRTYNNCIVFNLFGGLADKMVYTLRADSQQNKNKDGLGEGSKVLLLCINGEHAQAVIIGGVRDANDLAEEKQKAKELGHHFQLLFNGIEYFINKEGEFSLTYNGKSKADGKKEDGVSDSAIGSKISLLKDGNISLFTKDKAEEITIDHPNKKILLKAKQGIKIGEATDSLLKGTTFRNQQQRLHNQMVSTLSTLQGNITTAAVALTSAGASMATPVSGAVAAGPQITAAATALNLASQAIAQLSSAISSFEGSASQYLSKNNSSD